MNQIIKDVSDTSLWVAHYRSLESENANSLFKDPFAKILVGEKALDIEKLKSETTKWTQWTVVMRTVIIDRMIHDFITEGNFVFLNLGAGLDSRPYRMNLPQNVTWIEVDFPYVIEYKKQKLISYQPTCKLEQISMDLANKVERQNLLSSLDKKHEKIVVLTEGVLPYLTEAEVASLSEDLLSCPNFKFWITEYLSEKTYRYLKNPKRMKALKNAPFQFYPESWLNFFESRGWKLKTIQYYNEVAEKAGRSSPMPKIFKVFEFFLGKKWAQPYKRMSGYIIWKK